jgi:hypothetical protein
MTDPKVRERTNATFVHLGRLGDDRFSSERVAGGGRRD